MNDLDLLAAPLPDDHIAHAYVDPERLLEGIVDFVGHGLGRGEAVLALVPSPLCADLRARLADTGFALGFLEKSGQLRFVDAATILAAFVHDEAVDVPALQEQLTTLLAEARDNGRHARVRVVGTIADMLWRHRLPAAVTIERAWNDLVSAQRVSLLCPYTLDAEGSPYSALPHAICTLHSHTLRG